MQKVRDASPGARAGLVETTDNAELLRALPAGRSGLPGARRGRGRAASSPGLSTCCSWTRRARCRSRTRSPHRAAAKSVVLLGDPQQLEQPIQGTHPEGSDVSALEHMLAGEETMPDDRGLFLAETWRLASDDLRVHVASVLRGRLRLVRVRSTEGDTPGRRGLVSAVEYDGTASLRGSRLSVHGPAVLESTAIGTARDVAHGGGRADRRALQRAGRAALRAASAAHGSAPSTSSRARRRPS